MKKSNQQTFFRTSNPSLADLNKKADKIFEYVRKRGMPYYNFTAHEKAVEFAKLKNVDFNTQIINGIVKQILTGITLAWSYFPHYLGVQSGTFKTPLQVFNDDALLHKAIVAILKWDGIDNVSHAGKISDSQIRSIIKTASGIQTVSNFRPVVAAAIYRKYAGSGIVWDMSCGYGGRLLGAFASGAVKKYIGTEPCSPTFDGLLKMVTDFSHLGMAVELHKVGSEFFIPKEPIDLCFTSPPYFNTERYSDEATQSWKKFSTPHDWNEGFLRKTIKNCFACLKPGGYMIINIANVKTHKTLEADTVAIAQQEGFTLEETLKMRFSSLGKSGFKFEPIFIFRVNKQKHSIVRRRFVRPHA